jgi:hypothetical protein
MDINDKKALEEHIKSHIKSSGYPLEIQISNIVDKDSSFAINNTVYFFDEELHTGRSIDMSLMSMDTLTTELNPLFLRVDVPIECKKSESHAWVFYERERLATNAIYVDGQIHSTVQELSSETSFSYLFSEKLKLHYSRFTSQAVAYDEIKIQGNSDKKLVFEATNQLIKYVCYETHTTLKRIYDFARQKNDENCILLMFPAIVFDGLLYKASFDSGQLEIKETPHVLLHTQYRCPYCNKVESYTIDVIHSSYFPEYLNLIKANVTNSTIALKPQIPDIINIAREKKRKFIEKTKSEITVPR